MPGASTSPEGSTTSAATTAAPSPARYRLSAAPMPRAPPVTRTTVPRSIPPCGSDAGSTVRSPWSATSIVAEGLLPLPGRRGHPRSWTRRGPCLPCRAGCNPRHSGGVAADDRGGLMNRPAEEHHGVLVLSCEDAPGIVHAVSGLLVQEKCSIVESHQFDSLTSGMFYMRVEFAHVDGSPLDLPRLREAFE